MSIFNNVTHNVYLSVKFLSCLNYLSRNQENKRIRIKNFHATRPIELHIDD